MACVGARSALVRRERGLMGKERVRGRMLCCEGGKRVRLLVCVCVLGSRLVLDRPAWLRKVEEDYATTGV